MEFYPGTVFPLFLVNVNLASNHATGKFLRDTSKTACGAWLACVTSAFIVLCGPPFWIGVETTAFGAVSCYFFLGVS